MARTPTPHRLRRLAVALIALVAGGCTALLVGDANGPTAATAITHDLPGSPGAIAADAFDHIWFTDAGNKKIGRLNTNGTVDEFPDSKQLQGAPFDVTLGVSDQNIWVTEPAAHALAVVSPSS